MKITQEVRAYAQAKGISDADAALEAGLQERSEQFKQSGGEVYRKV
jgi:phosphomethylpyrimidine synthase